MKALDYTASVMADSFSSGDIVVDATVGTGRDASRLAELVGGNGKVYGFDIQPTAIDQARRRLEKMGLAGRVEFFVTGHENLAATIPGENHGHLAGVVFNLGYLPGGDKTKCTSAPSSILAIGQACELIRQEGVIIITGYTGHQGGEIEVQRVIEFASSLDQTEFSVIHYRLLNQVNNPPQAIIIYKK